MGFQCNGIATDDRHEPALEEGQQTVRRLNRIMDHRSWIATGNELSVWLVTPVGKDLREHAKACIPGDNFELRARDGQDRQVTTDQLYGVDNGLRYICVARRQIAKRPMELHVTNRDWHQRCNSLQGTDLGSDHTADLIVGHRDDSPTETFAIGVARVGANADTIASSNRECAKHGLGVARVAAAGDIRTRHHGQHRLVVAHRPGSETFAQVGVQINLSWCHRAHSRRDEDGRQWLRVELKLKLQCRYFRLLLLVRGGLGPDSSRRVTRWLDTAERTERSNMTNPNSPRLPTGIWKLDSATTTIAISLEQLGMFTVRASLAVADSTITMATNDEGDLGGSVKVTVDAASYNSGREKRDRRVHGTNFLDVQTHPTFDFVGTSMEPVETGYLVTGDVTVKGQTSTIVFDVTAIDEDGDRASFTARTTIDRQILGVTTLPSFVIGNTIDVSIAATAIRQS